MNTYFLIVYKDKDNTEDEEIKMFFSGETLFNYLQSLSQKPLFVVYKGTCLLDWS